MEGGLRPHLVAYRKDSSNRLFKVDKKSNKGECTSKEVASEPKPAENNRRRCGCSGDSHGVFSNCVSCGRLACSLEKQGPCFGCGSPVLPVDSPDLSRDYKSDPDYPQAILLRDKLLNLDRQFLALRVHDLHGGWFAEAVDVYNERSEQALESYLQEQAKTDVKYDLDLVTGRLSVSNLDHQ